MALALLWTGDYTPKVQWTLTALILLALVGFAGAVRARVVVPLQTLANLLAALREDDFSIRGRTANPDDPLGAALIEVNALAETLHEQRLGAVEATALLRTVMEQIDVAVFAFDPDAAPAHRQPHRRAADGPHRRADARPHRRGTGRHGLVRRVAAGRGHLRARRRRGRWEVRRTTFRLGGLPHDLLVLSDVSRPLREQERQAWQRLIRVIGHELGNSLGPIKSIAGSLETLLQRDPAAAGLARRHAARAAGDRVPDRLAQPLHRRLRAAGPPAGAQAQPDRPEAVPAAAGRPGDARPDPRAAGPGRHHRGGPGSARAAPHQPAAQRRRRLARDGRRHRHARLAPLQGTVDIWVDDEGPGLSNTANLFVPFFTTKPGGSGIGLVLCRQIAEAHEGSLKLENRTDGAGAARH